MNPDYLATITDSELKRVLLDPNNIPELEELLRSQSIELQRLQQAKEEGALDFGKRLRRSQWNSFVEKIKGDVESFLDVEEGPMPTVRSNGEFKLEWAATAYKLYLDKIPRGVRLEDLFGMPSQEYLCPLNIPGINSEDTLPSQGRPKISQAHVLFKELNRSYLGLLKDSAWTLMMNAIEKNLDDSFSYHSVIGYLLTKEILSTSHAPSIAHELAHHSQELAGIPCYHNIWGEGNARSVERNSARIFFDETGSEAALYVTLDRNVGELKSAYIWMCEENLRTPRAELLETKSSQDESEQISRSLSKKPLDHAIGNTLFLLYQLAVDDLSSRAIHGNFDFTKSPASYLRGQS